MASTAGQRHALIYCYGRHHTGGIGLCIGPKCMQLAIDKAKASVTVAQIDCYVTNTAA